MKEKTIQITRWVDDGVIIEVQAKDLQSAVEKAVCEGANLKGANLYAAKLYGANLEGANLKGANLKGAKNLPPLAAAQTVIVPDGDIIGWKKCRDNKIVKLLIPKEAKRSNATGRKCRAEYADVLEIIGGGAVAYSGHNSEFAYKVGERVTPDSFDENRWDECSNGIHFFITQLEAENWSV